MPTRVEMYIKQCVRFLPKHLSFALCTHPVDIQGVVCTEIRSDLHLVIKDHHQPQVLSPLCIGSITSSLDPSQRTVTYYPKLSQRLRAWIKIKIISIRITFTVDAYTEYPFPNRSARVLEPKGASPGIEPESAKARHSNKRLGFTTPPLERPDYTNSQWPEGSTSLLVRKNSLSIRMLNDRRPVFYSVTQSDIQENQEGRPQSGLSSTPSSHELHAENATRHCSTPHYIYSLLPTHVHSA
ncbi:hypothetical protein PROFUN_12141 [Planoprotostelium fungivorum]|uniref:Uncharacterized protein n=1 Tax=Planoprotostelium fungivorum TaxID=1890364 RepID=A0A2P6N8A9_9EUKA|nr:hypothetical protein PROFUN_12141 [Planoprotostelium fungivorum]